MPVERPWLLAQVSFQEFEYVVHAAKLLGHPATKPRPLPRRVPTHQPAAQPRPAPASVASDDVGSVAGDGSVHDVSVGGPSHVGLEATSDALSAASATGDVGFHTLVHAAAAEDEH